MRRCGCEDIVKMEKKMMPQNIYGPLEYNVGKEEEKLHIFFTVIKIIMYFWGSQYPLILCSLLFKAPQRKLSAPFKDKYSCILGVIILLCNNPMTLLIRAPDKRGYLG